MLARIAPLDVGKPSVNPTDVSDADQERVSYGDPVKSAIPFDVSSGPIDLGDQAAASAAKTRSRAPGTPCRRITTGHRRLNWPHTVQDLPAKPMIGS
jgi:hypothetical protein